MGRLIKRNIFIDPHYVYEFEEWLESMARKGLVFDHMNIKRKKCYFKKTEPTDMEYRVVVKRWLITHETDSEFREAGYEYVSDNEDIHIFAAKRKDICHTIYRDTKMELDSLKWYRNRQYRYSLIFVAVTAAVLIIMYFASGHRIPIATGILAGGFFSIPTLLIWLLFAAQYLIGILHSTRQMRQLAMQGDTRYRKEKSNMGLMFSVLYMGMLLLLVIHITSSLLPAGEILWQYKMEETGETTSSISMAALSEIEKDSKLEFYGYYTGLGRKILEIFFIKGHESYVEHVQWDQTKEIDMEEEEGVLDPIPYAFSEYWELKTDFLVSRFMKEQIALLEDRLEGMRVETENKEIEERQEEGLDTVYYVATNSQDAFTIMIEKDKKILSTFYIGDKSYEEVLAVMKEKLLEN